MDNGLWLVKILKDQPWIALAIGMVFFLGLYAAKRWIVKRLMPGQDTD